MLTLNRELNGKILDIGGGGEGVIGRLYTNQVVAIDIRQEELDEAPTGFEKILMDATQLDFKDNIILHTDVYECRRPKTCNFGSGTGFGKWWRSSYLGL